VSKAEQSCDSQPALRLALADGSRWTIRATDEPAALVVSGLGRAMRLRPGTSGRELYAVACQDRAHEPQKPSRNGTVVCCLSPLLNRDLHVVQMERIAAWIALESLPRGGLLLHGALAEYNGAGYIMAGPSGVGKSTASSRLPLPHRSLCDDKTLVVRDRSGRYWAHPWPTWSLLHNGRPDGSWPVEDAVPLQGIFFLRQSAFERLQPTDRTHATALIMESAIDLTRVIARLSEAGEFPRLWEEHLAAAKALAAAVPVYSLQTSIQGRFWTEIEQVLPDRGKSAVRDVVGDEESSPVRPPANGLSLRGGKESPGGSQSFRAGVRSRTEPPSEAGDGTFRAVCLGRAMNPTLAETDILEVEPYGRRPVCPGDVVCFKSPENAEISVRRVVSVGERKTGNGVSEDGIRTRGDNNRDQDRWLLKIKDIAGRVVAARSGSRWRPISGGLRGRATAALLSGVRPFRTSGRRMPDCLYDPAVKAGSLDGVLPQHLRPRLVEFNGRHWVDLKLLSAEREIGRYDCYLQAWRIRRPFRLFVDLRKLPAPTLWSRASFVQPSEVNAIPTVPETVSTAGYGDSENRELTGLSGSAPSSSDAGLAAAVIAQEQAIGFVTSKLTEITQGGSR
jgi:SynChlorMet cassette protein ScmC